MRLLLDQDVCAATAQFLSGLGHDVLRVAQIGLAQAQDEEILPVAQSQNRILLTRDRDYGNLVFVMDLGAGVLYLQVLPSTLEAVHAHPQKVLDSYSEKELSRAFVVIERQDIGCNDFHGCGRRPLVDDLFCRWVKISVVSLYHFSQRQPQSMVADSGVGSR